MATFSKPTIVPNWATTSGNIAVPSAGRRNDGWLTNEKPPSDIENWNKRTTGEWLEWINERLADGLGEPTIGAVTVVQASAFAAGVDTDTFILDDGVNPVVTFVYDDDSSVVETATLRAINHTGVESSTFMGAATRDAINAAPTLDITASGPPGDVADLVNDAIGEAGNIAIIETVADGAFSVTGMSGGVDVEDTIEITDPKSATAIAFLSAIGLKFVANKSVLLSGTGRYKHGEFEKQYAALSGSGGPSSSFDQDSLQCKPGAIGDNWVIPIDMQVGKTINSIVWEFEKPDTSVTNLSIVTKIDGSSSAFTNIQTLGDNTAGTRSVETLVSVPPLNIGASSRILLAAVFKAGHADDAIVSITVKYQED